MSTEGVITSNGVRNSVRDGNSEETRQEGLILNLKNKIKLLALHG